MLINNAFAQATEASASKPNELISFLPLILIFAVFYFLIIRPQSKKIKEHQNMVNNLKVGAKVMTNGGIVGVVKDVLTKDNQIEIEIASGVTIKVVKNYVAELVVPKDNESIIKRK